MIIIENTHVDNVVRAVYSARNAMNSWNRSDSDWNADALGKNDLMLAKQLSEAGNDHAKFLRMINVTMDITAPLYWWKEFDTYKVGTVANSCSTMHKIQDKEFTLDDFSHEHLFDSSMCELESTIARMNFWREKFIIQSNKETADSNYATAKQCWWQMIQLLPSSYNQKRTVQLNYAVLKNMCFTRRNHKLDCWVDFCKCIETLPYAKELICIE